ncbi:MAG: efflux RND transporter periplasmic adaptor subunit [Lachnospiraceae bacterium]|nr:efflux RND transporter periplasmic adaptor subunit [Lachnospiraceae bacterium]
MSEVNIKEVENKEKEQPGVNEQVGVVKKAEPRLGKKKRARAKNGEKKKGANGCLLLFILAVILIVCLVVVLPYVLTKNLDMNKLVGALAGDSTYTVIKSDIKQEIVTTGSVVGVDEKAYTSPVTAKIAEVRVKQGQLVKKGDILLVYDESDLGDNLDKVKLRARSEKASNNSAYDNVREAKEKLASAKTKAKRLKAQVKTLKADLEKMNDELSDQQKKLEEYQTKAAAGDPKAKKKAEELSEKMKKLNKKIATKNEKYTELQSDLAKEEGIISANEDVKISNSSRVQIEVANEMTDRDVEDAEKSYNEAKAGIVAEFDGIISNVSAMVGSYASEGQTLFTAIDSKKIGVRFTVSEDSLGVVNEGQKARVVIGGNTYSGKVDSISRIASESNLLGKDTGNGNIVGTLLLDDPDDNIYIGVSAKAYLFIGEAKDALVIPYDALCSDVDGDYVLEIDPQNILQRKDVKLGLASDDYYEVTEGLKEGDKIIKSITKDMKPGAPFTPEISTANMKQ